MAKRGGTAAAARPRPTRRNLVSENHANGHPGCEACGAPVVTGQERCDRCEGYERGYRDGLGDAVHELLWPAVARAARLSDPEALSYALGRAIAVGEARQSAPLMPTNGEEQ
jgi:hypothetical protein